MAALLRMNEGRFERATLNTEMSNATPVHRFFDFMGRHRVSVLARVSADTEDLMLIHVVRQEKFLKVGFPVLDPANPSAHDIVIIGIITIDLHMCRRKMRHLRASRGRRHHCHYARV
jgi:hypothetical protein